MQDLLSPKNDLVLAAVVMLAGIKFDWGPTRFAARSRMFLDHNSSDHAGAAHALAHVLAAPPPQLDLPNAGVLFAPSNSDTGTSAFPTQKVSVLSPTTSNLRVTFRSKMTTPLGDEYARLVVSVILPAVVKTQTPEY